MKCDICKAQTKTKKVASYNYRESGLSNLYLSGIEIIECKQCGFECPILPNVLDLYVKIAEAVVLKPTTLNGEEVRFLRKQAGYSGKAWATLLDIEPTVLSQWENNKKTIGSQSDRLIRLTYVRLLEERGEEFSHQRIMDRFAVIRKREVTAQEKLIRGSKYPYPIGYQMSTSSTVALC